MNREQETLGHSDINVMSSPEACLHVWGSTQKRGCWKTPRKQGLPDKDEGTYELAEAVAACTGTAQVQGNEPERGKWTQGSTPNQEAICN